MEVGGGLLSFRVDSARLIRPYPSRPPPPPSQPSQRQTTSFLDYTTEAGILLVGNDAPAPCRSSSRTLTRTSTRPGTARPGRARHGPGTARHGPGRTSPPPAPSAVWPPFCDGSRQNLAAEAGCQAAARGVQPTVLSKLWSPQFTRGTQRERQASPPPPSSPSPPAPSLLPYTHAAGSRGGAVPADTQAGRGFAAGRLLPASPPPVPVVPKPKVVGKWRVGG